MLKNKIKSLLALFGYSSADYARKLDIKPQALQTKYNKDAYKVKDLIVLAELTNTKLSFIDNEGKVIMTFEGEDLCDHE